MTPGEGGVVEFSEIMKVIAADAAKEEACVDDGDDDAEGTDVAPMAAPGQS
jgi:hypothetical protein